MKSLNLKNHYRQYAICLIAGALLTLSFAPYNLFFLAVLCPAVLFYFWSALNPGRAFITGYLFGLGLFGTGVHWLHISINLFGGINTLGAWFFTCVLVAYLAIYPALAGYIACKYRHPRQSVQLLIMIPACWTLMEWLRSWVLTGFPWLNLGYSQTDTTLSAFGPLTGVFGITWLLALSAALVVWFVESAMKSRLCAAILFGAIWAASMLLVNTGWTQPADQKSVALVQGAIPQEKKWLPEQRQKSIDLYASLSVPYWQDDLIIWPETAIPLLLNDATFLLDALQKKSDQSRADIMTGIPERIASEHRYYNSIRVIGKSNDIYRKRHLVPFGEFMPLDSLLRPVIESIGIPISNFSAGVERPLVQAANIPVGVSICFEDVFGEEIIDALPEAMLLINVSNDAWFGDSLAPHQHLQMARMRAVETGRYLLRATNTGISAIINEKGEIIEQSRQFTPDVISARVQLFQGMTPYARWGNWPVILLLLIACSMVYINRKTAHGN